MLPFAGGGAHSLRVLLPHLPPWIEAWAPELPGRGTRFREPLATSMEGLADDLLPALRDRLEGFAGCALLGHSMGALLAYELARRARLAGWPEPRCLVVSGRRPPQVPAADRLHDLERPRLLARLRALGGLPAEVAGHEELMDLMLPILRADLRADETYALPAGPPLACPVRVLLGADDDIARSDAERWGELTTGPCTVDVLPGGHFFVLEAPAAVGRAILAAMGESPR